MTSDAGRGEPAFGFPAQLLAWRVSIQNPVTRFFQRRSDPARDELEGLRKVLSRLKSTQAHMRSAVGAGVHLANSDFIRRFANIESFRRIPLEAQKRFCSELSDLELGLTGKDPGMAVGVGLYRIWLADVLAGRQTVAEMLGEELTELSRKAAGD